MANLVIDNAGNLYGTTPYGGGGNCQYGCGTVFEVNPASGTETVLHAFGGSDGGYPMGALTVDASGNFYSTTSTGGAHNKGNVFELMKSGQQWQATTLYDFTGSTGGASPNSGVIFDNNGNLYGAATEGGTNDVGTLYALVPNGGSWTQVVLHQFKAQSNDGQLPFGPPTLWHNWLIGATEGGGLHSEGAVYQVFR